MKVYTRGRDKPLAMATRAVSPVVGTVLLILIVASASAVVGAAAYTADPSRTGDLGPTTTGDATVEVHIAVSAWADGRLAIDLRRGPPIDVHALDVHIAIDGTPLAHQPSVPAYGQRGFAALPGGPFNGAAEPTWTAGERATLRLAATNEPSLEPGRRVSVTLSTDDRRLAEASAVVAPP